ncbi:MAG TPA: cytochrome c-550 PedF [Paracoccaceae bacterium]|nr:cytochrome c-550 PedF [Paracoccaceae bacterium]
MPKSPARTCLAAALLGLVPLLAGAGAVYSAGLPLTIEPVNTDALPDVDDEWLTENPYRSMGNEVLQSAVDIGASGFTQNCARCHGLGAVSGGLAPDLRYLTADFDGDEWYVERFRHGYAQDGVTKMPAFGDLLGQKAAWAIRTYIETRPEDGALDAQLEHLREVRDLLAKRAEEVKAGTAPGEISDEITAVRADLEAIAVTIITASGAPVADSAVSRAAMLLDGSAGGLQAAAEALTIGLSAAQ